MKISEQQIMEAHGLTRDEWLALSEEGRNRLRAITTSPEPDPGSNDAGCEHDFVCSGTAYGGDDESYHGEGRSYCTKCGADGDA